MAKANGITIPVTNKTLINVTALKLRHYRSSLTFRKNDLISLIRTLQVKF